MALNSLLVLIAKALVTGLVLWLIFSRVDLAAVGVAIAQIQWGFLFAAGLFGLVLIVTAAQRWRMVALALGQQVTLRQALIYNLVGVLFDNGLPTGLGADAFRTWSLYRDGVPAGLAARIVITDRVCAFALLIAVIGMGLPVLLAYSGEPVFKYAVPVVFVAGVAALVAVLGFSWIARFLPDYRVTRVATRLSKDLRTALFGHQRSAHTIFWAGLTQLCRIGMVMLIALGLQLNVTLLEVFVLAPASFLMAMVPISIGGWGLREAIFIEAFSLVGVSAPDALVLSILFGLIWLSLGLLGGLVWFAQRKAVGLPQAEEGS